MRARACVFVGADEIKINAPTLPHLHSVLTMLAHTVLLVASINVSWTLCPTVFVFVFFAVFTRLEPTNTRMQTLCKHSRLAPSTRTRVAHF